MPGCIVSATTANFSSVEKRRLRATPVITSTFENVSDIGTCLGLFLGPLGYRPCPVKTGCTPTSAIPGTLWPKKIKEELQRVDTFLLVIGPNWLQLQDEISGRRRIDVSSDWVRREIILFLS